MFQHHSSVPSKPTRVVVLGSRGFIASGLIQALRDADMACRAVGSAEVDLTDSSAQQALSSILRAEDSLVVCSALTPEKGRDEPTFMKNVRMVENVSAALNRAACAHVVYISSDSVYDPHLQLIDEQSPCASDDWYARSHIVRETLLRDACGNMPLAILRPSAVYGAGDTHNSYGPNRFVRSALERKAITLFGHGEELRDHIYIDDLTDLVKLTLSCRSAGVLNAVSGQARSFREVAETIVNVLGTSVAIEAEPRRVPITHRQFDAASLREAFPKFAPKRMESAIREMIHQLRGTERER